MNSSILTTNPTSPRPTPLFSPFLNPTPSLKFTLPSKTPHHQFRYRPRIFTIRSCSSASSHNQNQVTQSPINVLVETKQLSGFHSLVDSMSPPVRLASSVIVFAGAVVAGYGLGCGFGGSRNAGLGGAFAIGGVGAGVAYAMNSSVPEVAAVNLHNFVVGCDDPGALKKEDIESIANKLGQTINMRLVLCDYQYS